MFKYPGETVTVTFDFSDLATACANPVVTIAVESGVVDDSAASMISGSAQISGTNILQRVVGGIAGNTYKLMCQIDDADGERWIVAADLEVKNP